MLKPRVCPVVPMRCLCGVPANKTHAKCVGRNGVQPLGFRPEDEHVQCAMHLHV